MVHVKPGPLEGSRCFMLSLGPSRGQNGLCEAWAPEGIKMFHVKLGPLEGSKCFMLSLGLSRGQNGSC